MTLQLVPYWCLHSLEPRTLQRLFWEAEETWCEGCALFVFQAAQLTEVKNKLEIELTRKTTANNQLNAKITALKQDLANREGEITRLNTQIGELNSQNIRQTVQAHQRPYVPPHQSIPGRI